VDDFVLSPIPIPPRTIKRSITPAVAENVILSILRNLETFDDLFATAVLNRGFYRVFKRHELDLMKETLRKMSPPAWEHREICYPGHDQLDDEDLDVLRRTREYTPKTYFQYYTRDIYIIAALKGLIKDKCQSFVRPEMAVALISTDSSESSRVDDAMWRIWTFCTLFGCGKGREDDIVAQMDWLKGGILVHQQTCTNSILTTDAFDMNGTLASAPECFAMGNEGGLTAEELFDMMELWNCLAVLLQSFEGRTIQAREYGLYENTGIRGGDIDGEEVMLGKPTPQSTEQTCANEQMNGTTTFSRSASHQSSTSLAPAAVQTHPPSSSPNTTAGSIGIPPPSAELVATSSKKLPRAYTRIRLRSHTPRALPRRFSARSQSSASKTISPNCKGARTAARD
jgi:hypothetical protein